MHRSSRNKITTSDKISTILRWRMEETQRHHRIEFGESIWLVDRSVIDRSARVH